MSETRILLDVDGVLNAFAATSLNHWSRWRTEQIDGFTITWSEEVCEFLADIHNRTEVLWLTTWEREAQTMLAPALKLPNFGLAGARKSCPIGIDEFGNVDPWHSPWWKLVIAKSLWERDRTPFVWADDDLFANPNAMAWLGTLPEGSFLAICPVCTKGLTRDDLDRIKEFIEERSNNDG